LDAEIVNADAMQLYRGMDIGTAKVPPAQRRGIAHHQLDVLDVTEEASVAAYQKHARSNVQDILARRGCRAVVRGSGLYVRALLEVGAVTEEASVAADQKHARGRVQDILARRGCAVVVGGSGLYVRALLDRINFPGTDPAVRQKWQERADSEGPRALYQELQRQ